MGKINCWEYFKCGRESSNNPEGKTICPVAITGDQEGINGGVRFGRFCWIIPGTFCTNTKESDSSLGDYDFKEQHCEKCAFRDLVRKEEGEQFANSNIKSCNPIETKSSKWAEHE